VDKWTLLRQTVVFNITCYIWGPSQTKTGLGLDITLFYLLEKRTFTPLIQRFCNLTGDNNSQSSLENIHPFSKKPHLWFLREVSKCWFWGYDRVTGLTVSDI